MPKKMPHRLAAVAVLCATAAAPFLVDNAVAAPTATVQATPTPPPPPSFGTINGLGQSAEHEKITRAALACKGGETKNSCFEPASLGQLAGHAGSFGAVGAPDSDQNLDQEAHCDGADFLDTPNYPQTRTQATAALRSCLTHLRSEFRRGIDAAGAVLKKGQIDAGQTALSPECTFTLGVPGRAKCNAIEGLGRALHGTQDFYAHSNWSDQADPTRSIGINNPPGLAHTGAAPFLNMAGPAPSPTAIPQQLSTDCFTLAPFGWGCGGRVTHEVINKDTGTINPLTGAAFAATTVRGKIGTNFNRAVQSAITDTRAQWKGYRDLLAAKYGTVLGEKIACTITHDNPVRNCS